MLTALLASASTVERRLCVVGRLSIANGAGIVRDIINVLVTEAEPLAQGYRR